MDIHARVDLAAARLRQTCTMDGINEVLAAAFADLFRIDGFGYEPRSAPALYAEGITRGFYSTAHSQLEPDHRECAVIALLVQQQADANLALHLFIGLMSGLRARDVADLVFLAGVYAGTNVLTAGLHVLAKTFYAVICAADAGTTTPADVFATILRAYPDPAYDAARDALRKLAATPC